MALLHLFRREAGTAEQNPISYDQGLLELLRQDHRRLIRQVQELQKLHAQGQHKQIRNKLSEFRSLLQTHLMTENVRLYGYLTYHLGAHSEDARRAGDFRREMYGLGHQVMTFVKCYHDAGVTQENAAQFGKELAELGVLLVRRIRREETDLFPLYGAPRHTVSRPDRAHFSNKLSEPSGR